MVPLSSETTNLLLCVFCLIDSLLLRIPSKSFSNNISRCRFFEIKFPSRNKVSFLSVFNDRSEIKLPISVTKVPKATKSLTKPVNSPENLIFPIALPHQEWISTYYQQTDTLEYFRGRHRWFPFFRLLL